MKQRLKKQRKRFEISFVRDEDFPEEALTLDEIRKFLPTSKWRHSKVYEYAVVAKEKSILLSEFMFLPPEDQAYELAIRRVEATMQGYNDYLAEKAAKKK